MARSVYNLIGAWDGIFYGSNQDYVVLKGSTIRLEPKEKQLFIRGNRFNLVYKESLATRKSRLPMVIMPDHTESSESGRLRLRLDYTFKDYQKNFRFYEMLAYEAFPITGFDVMDESKRSFLVEDFIGREALEAHESVFKLCYQTPSATHVKIGIKTDDKIIFIHRDMVEDGEKKYYHELNLDFEASYLVVHVSLEDAVAFCEWLSRETGELYRLPSEVEWEFAARGGKKSRGYRYAGSNDLDQVAWHEDSKYDDVKIFRGVYPVGIKEPNELGIYDMLGNVYEMCINQNHDTSRMYKIKQINRNAIRGGSWIDSYIEISDRPALPLGVMVAGMIGFRVVKINK